MDVRGRDGDLAHRGVARHGEFPAQRVVQRHLHAAVVRREEEDPGVGHAVQPLAVVGILPAGRGTGGGLAHPARDIEVLAEKLRSRLALHDVVGRPAFRLGLHRAPEGRQRRGHGCEARPAAGTPAEGCLEPFAQVRRQDVALDERVPEEGDPHRAPGCQQRVAEGPQQAAGAVILDRRQRLHPSCRVRLPHLVGGEFRRKPPFVAGGDLPRRRVRLDARSHLRKVDPELLLVVKLRALRHLLCGRIVERHQVREDVRTPQADPPDALRGNETYGHEHCNECRGRQPGAMGIVFFRGVHSDVSRCAVRGSERRSRGPKRWRSAPPPGRCVPPTKGPP